MAGTYLLVAFQCAILLVCDLYDKGSQVVDAISLIGFIFGNLMVIAGFIFGLKANRDFQKINDKSLMKRILSNKTIRKAYGFLESDETTTEKVDDNYTLMGKLKMCSYFMAKLLLYGALLATNNSS